MNGEWPICETDPLMDDLKTAAFEVILLNPGCEHSEWVQMLVEQYGTEVVDALGNNPLEVFSDLDNLWDSPYLDKNSGLEYTFNVWAETLCNEAVVDMYYALTEQINELKGKRF